MILAELVIVVQYIYSREMLGVINHNSSLEEILYCTYSPMHKFLLVLFVTKCINQLKSYDADRYLFFTYAEEIFSYENH